MTTFDGLLRGAARRRGIVNGQVGNRPLVHGVLQMIWQEREISRAEIARRAGLSRSTVSEVVDLLLPTGLVAEAGPGESMGGRRPILLRFQDDACCILGAEMGASHVSVVMTDLRGRAVEWQHRDHPVRTDPEGTRRLLVEMCASALRRRRGMSRRLVGIGVAVPSPVDPRDPFTLSRVVMPEWGGHSGLESLGKRFRVPVMVGNDANLGAVAEHLWGAGRGIQDLAYVKVGTGVGSGHIINGELYCGAAGFAGEIGHLSMDPLGELCSCGLRGCLALFVGSAALVRRARKLVDTVTVSTLKGQEITMTLLEAAAQAEDPLALRVVGEAAEFLGIAISGMINLVNPSLVIVGGGITSVGERFLEVLRDTVRLRTRVSGGVGPSIVMSQLGPQTVAFGAATLVLKAALDSPAMFPQPGAAQSR